ncbi:hypothetical protein GGX14DRAFT_568512 [Mycena pura]|uniref:DUF6533 domain-containing protein n=1 Tax=Mycena pura TaxID=153505 RepID=A0AAD6VG03_9AGAR|nr:hypothetical protein GGX14DRAFT_568512 [Mycena pura]
MDSDTHSLVATLQVVAYVKAAFLTLLVYDTLLHFGQEYRYVWKSRWSIINFLYLWTRYSTFIDSIVAVQGRVLSAQVSDSNSSLSSTERLDIHRDAEECSRVMTFTTIFAGFGIGVSEIILMIRTYALYERSQKLLAAFVVLWFSVSSVNLWAVLKWTRSFKTEASPSPVSACFLGNSNKIGLVCYASLLASETLIVLLTLWKPIQECTSLHSELVSTFYRDGVLFYLAILPFSIANVVLLFLAPPGLNLLADTPLRVMHSILCCRLVTHIRSVMSREETHTMHVASAIVFATNSVVDDGSASGHYVRV